MSERWASIPGYDGYYEVSETGCVRSTPRVITDVNGRKVRYKGKVVSLTRNPDGHIQAQLCRDGGRRVVAVNRLMLMAFVGDEPNLQSCHRNGIPDDNRLENLYWGTSSDNALDTVRHGRNAFANRTHCPKRHEYTPENLYLTRAGHRRCRACEQKWARDAQRRKRAADGTAKPHLWRVRESA